MNQNYLAVKKQSVRYWSKVSALILTGLPVGISLLQEPIPPWANHEWKDKKAVVIGCLVVMGMITYYTSYYTLSSLFWPEPLSIFNHLLLIPCLVLTSISIWDTGQLLLTRIKTNNC